MEKEQGFLSALKEEVVRGLSPARLRERSSGRGQSPVAEAAAMLLPRRRKAHGRHSSLTLPPDAAALVARSVSFRETLAPLMEGPDDGGDADVGACPRKEGWGRWVRDQLSRAPSVTYLPSAAASASTSFRRSDLRLLLGVMGAPLAPVHVNSADLLPHLTIKDAPIVSFAFFFFLLYSVYIALSAPFFRSWAKSTSFWYALYQNINGVFSLVLSDPLISFLVR